MKTLLSFLTLLLLLTGCTTPDKHPNILFFLIDDQRNDVLSCAGHPIVKTPTVDFLAENGVRFENAFVTTSICAASRASIFTGLYESKHGYTFGTDPISEEHTLDSYPLLLKQNGYRTGFIGKFGVKLVKQDSLLAEMFDYLKIPPRSTPHFITLPDGSRRHSAEIKGDQAIEFISTQNDSVPWCLSVSFNAVHAVDGNLTPGNEGHYPYPAAVANMYEGMVMPPPRLNDPAIFDAHPDFMKNSMHRERFFWRWDTEEKYQVNMTAYFRMISGYDRVMQRVIDALEEKGFDENTVIIYSADNGYYMGNRGFAGKWSHYEESLRVPMVIYDPRLPDNKRGYLSEKPVLNIDIPSTILGLAGVDIPEAYQGMSMLPLINQNTTDWREDFLIEHRMNNPTIPKYVGFHTKRYVYANYYEQYPPYEYLHDLESDPDELRNLADDPDYKDILDEMRLKCTDFENKIK